MGEKDLYDYWSETYKVHTSDWSPEKASEILKEWTEKFSLEVAHIVKQKNMAKNYDINAFSSSHLDTIMEEFSEVSFSKISLGYFLMVSWHFIFLSFVFTSCYILFLSLCFSLYQYLSFSLFHCLKYAFV
jgi:hypothetical protein